MSTNSNKITALIISYNEMDYIQHCIQGVSFADEIIVVDSYSNDGTYEYLKQQDHVKVVQRTFSNFTDQKSYAMSLASHNWIVFVDADEVIHKELQEEILQTVKLENPCSAYWFYRNFMFKNKRLLFSGWQTDKNYRLFQKDKVKFTDKKLVHETLEVTGKSGRLKQRLTHYCYKNYQDYKGKMIKYGKLKAKEAFYREDKFTYLALIIKPAWRFLYQYIFRLGILDGKKGLTICYLNALGVHTRFMELKKLEKKNELVYYLMMP